MFKKIFGKKKQALGDKNNPSFTESKSIFINTSNEGQKKNLNEDFHLSEEEIENLVKEEIWARINKIENKNYEYFDNDERDELLEDAAKIIVETQKGSSSLIQRKLKLGYNRAGRIIDQLEILEIVSPRSRKCLAGNINNCLELI